MTSVRPAGEHVKIQRAMGFRTSGDSIVDRANFEYYNETSLRHSIRLVEGRMVGASILREEHPDVYGQFHPVETDEMLARSLLDFDEAVENVPTKKKLNVLEAQTKCPDLLTESFKLMFLRCECFRVDLAAKRYAKYWDKRVEAFGPITAFQPLILAGALRNDTIPLELGAMQIIRRKADRDILYFDPSKLDKTLYSRESACRAFWYFFHALLEDEEVQKRGIIILNYNANFTNANRDPPFTKMCFNMIKGALPIRMSAIHGCQAPLMYACVASLVMFFLGDRLRKRILAHNGSTEYILSLLEGKYGIDAEYIPTDMGGELQLDVRAWLKERAAAGL